MDPGKFIQVISYQKHPSQLPPNMSCPKASLVLVAGPVTELGSNKSGTLWSPRLSCFRDWQTGYRLCAVSQESQRQSFSFLGKAKRLFWPLLTSNWEDVKRGYLLTESRRHAVCWLCLYGLTISPSPVPLFNFEGNYQDSISTLLLTSFPISAICFVKRWRSQQWLYP